MRATIWTDQVRIEPDGPDACRVSLSTDDARAATIILLGLGVEFTVESPDALVEELRVVAARYLRAAGDVSRPRRPGSHP